MDVSTTSIRSKGSTGKPRTGKQPSSIGAKSEASTSSPRSARKPLAPSATIGVTTSAANGKTTPRSKTTNGASWNTPGPKDRADHLRPDVRDRKLTTGLVKSKADLGRRRPDRTPSGTVTPTTTPRTTLRNTEKNETPKGAAAEKNVNKDINRKSTTEELVRIDSSNLEKSSKTISAKIYELRTELVHNASIISSLKEFVQGGVENFVVLPLGSFSSNPQSMWRAAMMEVLLEITVPKRRLFMDPSLSEAEKESLRSHAFLHPGDELPADIVVGHSVRAPGITLFYVPMGDVELIENLIEENEDRLEHIVVIGNSLHKLAENAPKSSRLHKHVRSIQEETFFFDLFAQRDFGCVFAELRGHRFVTVAESSPRYSDVRASSCETLNLLKDPEASKGLKTAVSAPNLGPQTSRVPSKILTIGAVCCGAVLAWMFINKR